LILPKILGFVFAGYTGKTFRNSRLLDPFEQKLNFFYLRDRTGYPSNRYSLFLNISKFIFLSLFI